MRTYCNQQVQFGLINRGIGYLRILSFQDYTEEKSAEGNLHALDAALDEVFDHSQRLTGLIVDIRINGGGSDRLAIVLASRLAREKYLAYSKVIRNNLDGPLHFTEPQPIWVVPGARPGFKGKVVLLAGADTVSAGETFTMALMGRRPAVIHVGDDTQGVFSDELRRTLPNGWCFSLPNEVFLTERGKAFDAVGVPPSIRVSVFSGEDLREGRDAALDKALEILGR
jgi:C-terminal processing protease CtpA/Prc